MTFVGSYLDIILYQCNLTDLLNSNNILHTIFWLSHVYSPIISIQTIRFGYGMYRKGVCDKWFNINLQNF